MHYSFTTSLSLDAPVTRVWDTIHAVSEWKTWWPAVRAIESNNSTSKDQKEITTLTIGTFFYSLTFSITLCDYKINEYMNFDSTGDLVGNGTFLFCPVVSAAASSPLPPNDPAPGVTHLTFKWNVATTKPWMNRYGKILRPFFITAHNVVMNQFARGLARTLHAKLHSVHNSAAV